MLLSTSHLTRPAPAREDALLPGLTRPTPASSHPPAPSLPSQAHFPGDAPCPPLTIVGSSLGGWIAWLMAQRDQVERLIFIAPAFNMMGVRAKTISPERRHDWHSAGWMPWDDDPLHREWPLSWKWVEKRRRIGRRASIDSGGCGRRSCTVPATVIAPEGSREFADLLRRRDPCFPVELHLVPGDHRLNGPEHMKHLHRLLLEPMV